MDRPPEIGTPLWGPSLARCWRGVCPRCGEGRLFASHFRLRTHCDSCGLMFRKDGGMTGQMYVSAAVTEIFAVLVMVLLFVLTDWSTWVAISVGLVFVIAFSYWLLPRAMSFWVGVEYATDTDNERHAAASFARSERRED